MRALLIFALTACTQSPADRLPAGERPPVDRTARGLVVHEWGTYTSLQGSDGRSMDGLHHAEHLLPPFVFARDPSNELVKGIPSLPEPVNQKLETPVLYFYGDERSATVNVRFPEGIISEWYPDAIAFSPPLDDMPRMAGGSMTWSVDLVDPEGDSFAPFEVEADSVWAPSRRVKSLGVKYIDPQHVDLRDGYQDEHFIFYRGLGRFERPVSVRSSDADVTVLNGSRDLIPAAFLLSITTEGGSIAELGSIGPGGQKSATIPPPIGIGRYLPGAKGRVERALIETGLYEDEARAMVETWEESYFTSPGTRILYIAPRRWTDELLPIEITPRPVELVRTLVGRIEVMTRTEEVAVVAAVQAAFREQRGISADAYGRFTEPKLRRAMELIDDPGAKSWCQSLVDTLAALP